MLLSFFSLSRLKRKKFALHGKILFKNIMLYNFLSRMKKDVRKIMPSTMIENVKFEIISPPTLKFTKTAFKENVDLKF